MLTRIEMQHVAIVSHLSVTLDRGFTVITGETGAGKSLLIGAIAMAFGSRASGKEVIQTGEKRARVELTFTLSSQVLAELEPTLREAGVDLLDGEQELLVSREWTETASRYRINGSVVNRDVVISLRPHLIDLHGQHELTSLFNREAHRQFLDALGDERFQTIKQQVASAYGCWKTLCDRLNQIETQHREIAARRDYLAYQLEELDAAELDDPQEDTAVQARLNQLTQIDALQRGVAELTARFEGDGDSPGLLDQLAAVEKNMAKLCRLDHSLNDEAEELVGPIETLKDWLGRLQHYGHSLADDPEERERLSDRVDLLEKLKRKHGPTLAEVIVVRENVRTELEQLTQLSEGASILTEQVGAAKTQLEQLICQLSAQRQALAKTLPSLVLPLLQPLGLPYARFVVALNATEVGEQGAESVEFLFSANPGEPEKPLGKVASGGELSRFLLALKVVLAQHKGTPTLVFDEIDTGISGPMARAVGQQLKQLAALQEGQVVAITHQPLVAALGDDHLHVQKVARPEGVNVTIQSLKSEPEKRKQMLAKLTSGLEDGETDSAIARFVEKLLIVD